MLMLMVKLNLKYKHAQVWQEHTHSLYGVNIFQCVPVYHAPQLSGVELLTTQAREGQWQTKMSIRGPKWHGHWDYITMWNSTEGGKDWSKVIHEIKRLKGRRDTELSKMSQITKYGTHSPRKMWKLTTAVIYFFLILSQLLCNALVLYTAPGHSCCVLLQNLSVVNSS